MTFNLTTGGDISAVVDSAARSITFNIPSDKTVGQFLAFIENNPEVSQYIVKSGSGKIDGTIDGDKFVAVDDGLESNHLLQDGTFSGGADGTPAAPATISLGDVVITANDVGAAGNAIDVVFEIGSAAGAGVDTVSVSGNIITVTLRGDGATDQAIAFAINADPEASALVTATVTPDVIPDVTAGVTIALTGGVDGAAKVDAAGATAADGDVVITANDVGAAGNAIDVVFEIGSVAGIGVDTISVSGNIITVTLRGDGATVRAIVFAINDDNDASALVTAAVAADADGAAMITEAVMVSLSGGTAGLNVDIPEDTAGGTVLYTAQATDADGNSITYSLDAANNNAAILDLFEIDDTTGAISLKSDASLDHENAPRHSLTVTATAEGDPAVVSTINTTTQTVTINVTDVNEAPEVVANAATTANAVIGRSFSLNAASFFKDVDAGDTLSYSLSSTNLPVWIANATVTATGQITATVPADDSSLKGDTFDLTITAKDTSGLSVSHTVTITYVESLITLTHDDGSPDGLVYGEDGNLLDLEEAATPRPGQEGPLDENADATALTADNIDTNGDGTNNDKGILVGTLADQFDNIAVFALAAFVDGHKTTMMNSPWWMANSITLGRTAGILKPTPALSLPLIWR